MKTLYVIEILILDFEYYITGCVLLQVCSNLIIRKQVKLPFNFDIIIRDFLFIIIYLIYFSMFCAKLCSPY